MFFLFIIKSFFVGILAVCGLGPVCIITLNRTTKYGLLHGIVSAAGACVGDGLLFFLGLLGFLNVVNTVEHLHMILNVVGGMLMCVFGVTMLDYHPATVPEQYSKQSLVNYWIKPFLLTVFSPASCLFFILAVEKLYTQGNKQLSLHEMLWGTLSVSLGSFVTLSFFVYLTALSGNFLKKKYLQNVAYVSGVILIGAGAYLVSTGVQMFFYPIL